MARFWRNDTQVQTAFLMKFGDRLSLSHSKSGMQFYFERFIMSRTINERSRYWGGFLGSILGWCIISSPLVAQITPDDTLGTEANTTDNVTEITGGTETNSNLFHSFQDFSVETGNTAFFNNDLEINNIIGRVTGNNLSTIDGLIRANGNANLILINPKGISFGGNASLDIGGSFLGSTADSIIFEDGTVFNTDLTAQPLLTVSTPVGLQLGQNSAEIQVSGLANGETNLAVNPGNTFALVGNGITFNGGMITAASGRIDLGSVAQGEVSLTEIDTGWQLGYAGVTQFADLQLLAGTSLFNPNDFANSTGGIQLQGNNIVLERSQIVAQTLGNAPGSNIVINAEESLSLTGVTKSGVTSSQISNDVSPEATGEGGIISITTDKLNIAPRSFIGSMTFGAGTAGDINISATDVNITGTGFTEFQQIYQVNAFNGSLQPGDRITGIFAGTATTGIGGNIKLDTNSLNLNQGAIIFNPVFTAGIGGDIDITATDIDLNASALHSGGGVASIPPASVGDINIATERLQVSDGANIINLTLGEVAGGNINITAEDAINLINTPSNSIVPTGIITNSILGSGAGGDIDIQANTITIDNAGIFSNSGASLSSDGQPVSVGGSGGNINIQADESIKASGILLSPVNSQLAIGSGIGASTFSPSDGGNLTISTGKLIIRDGASFTSAAFGTGDGGELTINASDSIELIGTSHSPNTPQTGLITTSNNLGGFNEVSGNSGNINIATPELVVRDGAKVDVQSFGTGRAGSLAIFADSILLENLGALVASTVSGGGGDIKITTNTLKLNQGLINASVLGSGTGGNIEIEAQDSVEVVGSGFEFVQTLFSNPSLVITESLANLNDNLFNQGILAATIGTGKAGTISITSPNLKLTEGALIATATAGDGAAGSIILDNLHSLTLDASIISGSTLFAGKGGNIFIDTNKLEIFAGGQLNSATLGTGNSGNVIIDAAESITVSGTSANKIVVSSIEVGAQPLPTATGNGGDLTINTANLNLDDQGTISVSSIGSGNAGSLQIDADMIALDNQSTITADTQSGGGGNIFISTDNIFWRGASSTSATARGSGNGGNIVFNAKNLVVLEGSRISADAFMGMGGNIEIDTQGLFICGECEVTASSTLGLDGIVDIETLEPTNLDALDVPQQPTQAQEVVAVGCPSQRGASNSQLTITGRGGLPSRPQELLNAQSIIEFADSKTQIERSPDTIKKTLPPPARSWYKDAQGNVILTAQTMGSLSENSALNFLDCH